MKASERLMGNDVVLDETKRIINSGNDYYMGSGKATRWFLN
jgi:hypothetical protein